MSRENIRLAVTDKIMSILNTMPDAPQVEFENNLVIDVQKQSKPFLAVRIKFISADQVGIGNNPEHRFRGQIELAAAVKEGQGSSPANKILDYIYPKLHKTQFGKVRTLMADTGPTRPHLGWNYYPMLIPFWSDQPS